LQSQEALVENLKHCRKKTGCSNVHVFESIGRDETMKKLREFCDSERGWKFECTGATRFLLQKCRQ